MELKVQTFKIADGTARVGDTVFLMRNGVLRAVTLSKVREDGQFYAIVDQYMTSIFPSELYRKRSNALKVAISEAWAESTRHEAMAMSAQGLAEKLQTMLAAALATESTEKSAVQK